MGIANAGTRERVMDLSGMHSVLPGRFLTALKLANSIDIRRSFV